jgi:hypothetical protein
VSAAQLDALKIIQANAVDFVQKLNQINLPVIRVLSLEYFLWLCCSGLE